MAKKKKRSRGQELFTIGFDGPVALIDKVASEKYGKLSTSELISHGLFRAATISALLSNNNAELQKVAIAYNNSAGTTYSVEELPRLFGVSTTSVEKILVL